MKPVAYINVEERKLEWAKPTAWETPTIAKMDKVPLYTHPLKELTPLTEDECRAIIEKHNWFAKSWAEMAMEIQDAILRKAQEK